MIVLKIDYYIVLFTERQIKALKLFSPKTWLKPLGYRYFMYRFVSVDL